MPSSITFLELSSLRDSFAGEQECLASTVVVLRAHFLSGDCNAQNANTIAFFVLCSESDTNKNTALSVFSRASVTVRSIPKGLVIFHYSPHIFLCYCISEKDSENIYKALYLFFDSPVSIIRTVIWPVLYCTSNHD